MEKNQADASGQTKITPLTKGAGIIVTGAAGFIGSCMVQYLNEQGFENLILVDKFGSNEKEQNWKNKRYAYTIERDELFDSIAARKLQIDYFIHLGARTDTTEFDYAVHEELNLEYSKDVWNFCTINNIPLIYASSAATYGAGEQGYYDNNELAYKLHPLNPYGISKNEFDKWALQQENRPPFWVGLKFFNVYGPNEYHKGRMASVIYHSFNQIKKDGEVKLFRSHKEGFTDGEQLRDFIYVKDVVKIIYWMMNHKIQDGIYNVGTGKARSFNDLVKAVFSAMDMKPNIVYIDMPEDIRDKYQYFTQASMQKLRNAGYTDDFYSLENGVSDYVRNYLIEKKIW